MLQTGSKRATGIGLDVPFRDTILPMRPMAAGFGELLADSLGEILAVHARFRQGHLQGVVLSLGGFQPGTGGFDRLG